MYTKKNQHGWLIVAMLFIAQFSLAQSQYRFQHFDTRAGLMDDFVLSIAQDSLGFMWFQYFAGVTRFDGYNFKVYKYDKDDSLKSSLDFLLGGLRRDQYKNIWITRRGHPPGPPFTLAQYDREKDGFIKFTADLDLKSINRFRIGEDGLIWVCMKDGNGLHVLDMKTNTVAKYVNLATDKDTHIRQNTIFSNKDMGSSILVATQNGLWSFDKASKTFNRPSCPPRDSAFLYNTTFFQIVPKDELWLLMRGAFIKLGPDLAVLDTLELPPAANFTSMDIDSDGIFWFGTGAEGIYRADPKDDSFINIRHLEDDPYSLKSNKVFDVTVDRDQNVWVATGKGLSKLPRKTMGSVNLNLNLGDNAVGGFFKAKNEEFIVVNKALPPNSWEILLGQIPKGQLRLEHFKRLATLEGAEVGQFFKGKQYFWVSVARKGIFGFPIDPKSESVTPGQPLIVRGDGVSYGFIWEDSDENLWAGGEDGLTKINRRISEGENGAVMHYKHLDADTNSISSNAIFQIYPEDDSSLWVVTERGVDLFHYQTEKFEHVFKDRESPNNIYKSSDGTLFLATLNGLYEAQKVNGRYRFDKHLWDRSEVKGIQEDHLGRLWLRSSMGMICYDRQQKTALEFNQDDGVIHFGHYQVGGLDKTSDGRMFMVHDGVTLLNPATLTIDRKLATPVLTKLEVNNKPSRIGSNKNTAQNDFFITADISVLDELTIDYQHNNFSIEFSSMEMTAPEKNLYRHKLEGYDEDWIETDFRNRTVTYTNLDAGDYTFRVKASNHHGIWSDTETTLKIKVLPPPWRTSWAYTGYGLLFVGLLFLGRRNIVQRERLKSNLKLAKVEQEKEHFELEKAIEVDKVKSTFFANISHEFRTPLTLIKGPVQNLLEQFADHPNVKEQLKLVQRNSDLLLKLINQLLDLAKLESGNLTVEKSENDLNSFLTAVINSFSSLAFQKSVALEIELPSVRYQVSFDKDKVETILINLINNAVKFTPAEGRIKVIAELNTSNSNDGSAELVLFVLDTGIGIPIDQQTKVFERFHQVSEAHKEVGTGIGLSLVKELVALMKGTISLKSEPGDGLPGEQTGTEFRVTLPVEVIRVLSETDEAVDIKEHLVFEEFSSNGNGQESAEGDSRPRVLVVEDNSDLRKFIIDSLGKEFRFLEGADGKQGMEKAFEETPELIISDVMMPEMDGITMTGKLKNDTRTSHIPIILLTAKTSDESKMSGLQTGADDYLTKPFNKNELLLKVRNSIALRVKLREKLKLELLKESPNVEVQSADEKFLLKVRDAILSRLSDEQLSVESLADEIGLSRSQLFRKISALTGASVNELIRTFRLQRAAQLIEQNWAPVTQVAYEVGYSNLSYFSKAFKEKYGVSPSEYPVKTN